jgi:NADP-dependent 3-hydroxy acid dehydrogenase YdfG
VTGRVIAITGASAGIGRACATVFASRGALVAASARRADLLQTLVDDIARHGGHGIAVPGDVTREADMETLVERTVATFGGLDVMICNAGIGFHGTLEQTPGDVMRRVIDVNLLGTLYAARAALRVMRSRGRGHIIAVSSIVGRRGVAGSSVYAATKAAQVGFIESLRAEFAGTNLYASVVFPVATTTEFREAITRDFGHTVEGRGPRQAAETVANAIARCIESPRPEVYPLKRARVLAVLSVVAPAFSDRLVRRFGRRQIAAAASDQ